MHAGHRYRQFVTERHHRKPVVAFDMVAMKDQRGARFRRRTMPGNQSVRNVARSGRVSAAAEHGNSRCGTSAC